MAAAMHAPTAPSGRTAHSTVVLISAHLETLRGIYDKGGKQMPANAGLVMHSCVRKCGVTTATLGLPGGYARPFIGADAIMANVDALLKLFKVEQPEGVSSDASSLKAKTSYGSGAKSTAKSFSSTALTAGKAMDSFSLSSSVAPPVTPTKNKELKVLARKASPAPASKSTPSNTTSSSILGRRRLMANRTGGSSDKSTSASAKPTPPPPAALPAASPAVVTPAVVALPPCAPAATKQGLTADVFDQIDLQHAASCLALAEGATSVLNEAELFKMHLLELQGVSEGELTEQVAVRHNGCCAC